jgi:hypothetical protein
VSAAGAHLALVPPTADAAASPPFDALVRSSEAQRRGSARARQAAFAMWTGGCALLVAGPLLAPFSGDLSLVGMGFGGVLLLGSGLALFGLAVVDRTRESVRALVVAPVMLAATGGLMNPARRAAIELHVAAHQQELDALAAEIRAGFAGTPRGVDRRNVLEVLPRGNFGARFRRLDVERVTPVDGGLLFSTSVGMGYTLLYADGVRGPADECVKPRMRFIGGRWYERQCLDRAED